MIAIESYEQLLQLLRNRMAALDTSFERVEAVSGISDRYLSRVLGPHPSKGLGPVTFSIFGALGLRVVLVEDPELLDRVRDRLRRHCRKTNGMHSAWVQRQQAGQTSV
jgi:hypothetical protein